MINQLMQGVLGQIDPLSLILSLLWFVLIFVSLCYGTKFQGYLSQKKIESGLGKLKKWNEEGKQIVLHNFKKYADKNDTEKSLSLKLEDFLNFKTIGPINLDPYDNVPKIDHMIDVRDNNIFEDEVLQLAPNVIKGSPDAHNLARLLEAAMGVDYTYGLVKHYLFLAKKSKSYILIKQISIRMSLILVQTNSLYRSLKDSEEF